MNGICFRYSMPKTGFSDLDSARYGISGILKTSGIIRRNSVWERQRRKEGIMNTLKCRIGQLFCLLFVSVSKRDTEPDAEPAPDPNVPKREKSAEAPSIPEWPGVKRPESAVSGSVHTVCPLLRKQYARTDRIETDDRFAAERKPPQTEGAAYQNSFHSIRPNN